MDNTKQKIHDRIRSRRAVAPIIATLLMIAIAVVGGVMIYVFTQGFFGNSSISTSPSVDTITMSGYDMREIDGALTGITNHANLHLVGTGDTAITGLKDDGEAGTIFLRNVGQKSYSISKLEVNGVSLSFAGAVNPAAGEYAINTPPTTAVCDNVCLVAFQPANTILPGEEATLIVAFENAGGVDNTAAQGRTIPIKITSASGSVYNFNVVVGSKL